MPIHTHSQFCDRADLEATEQPAQRQRPPPWPCYERAPSAGRTPGSSSWPPAGKGCSSVRTAAVPKPAGMGSSQQAVAPAVAVGEEHEFTELSPLCASSLIWEQLSWKVAGCQLTLLPAPGQASDTLSNTALSWVIRPQRAPGQEEQAQFPGRPRSSSVHSQRLDRGFRRPSPTGRARPRPHHPTPAAAAPLG